MTHVTDKKIKFRTYNLSYDEVIIVDYLISC